MDPFSSRSRSWQTWPIILAALTGMALLDYHTGQELVFSCTYLIPVSLTAWWLTRRWMIMMSVISGLTAFTVDLLDGYEYSHPGIGYWNGFTCFLISIVTGVVLCRLKVALQEKQRSNDELRAALSQLEASTAEIRQLQAGLQTVCAWTKRVQVGDRWMTPDEFLCSQLHLKLTHGISPEGLRIARAELAQVPKAA